MAAIGCWIRGTALMTNQREAQYKKALLTSISVSNTTLNTRIEGQHGFKTPKTTFKGHDGKTHDLSWIYKG